MPHDSPFRVHVADLLRSSRPRRSHRLVVPVDWGVELSRLVPEPPLEADLELGAVSGGVLVRGAVSAVRCDVCVRCLAETEVPMQLEIAALVEREGGDDGYELEGDEIDLEPILRDEIVLAMPLLPSCGPGCPGLVPASESGLYTASAGETGRADSPFVVLQDLFETGD